MHKVPGDVEEGFGHVAGERLIGVSRINIEKVQTIILMA
jgi:hypothetical protein